jgi:hypothetical protein
MKTYFNIRSTIGNNSWPRRGLIVLATLAMAAVIGIALIQALRPGSQAIPGTPAVQVAKPATPNPNLPISGTGSAYDGGSYGSPYKPISGAGSATDGSAYVDYLLSGPSTGAAEPRQNMPVPAAGASNSGSAYAEYIEYLTGRPLSASPRPAAPNPNLPISGTGSAYDGGSYGSPRPTAQAQPTGLGIDLPPGTDLGGMPAGLTDYLRRNP